MCGSPSKRIVQGRLEHLGFLVRLYCGWSKCRTEFYSPRWRDPAYHTATCKQMAYYERKKAGYHGRETRPCAASPARARLTARIRPIASDVRAVWTVPAVPEGGASSANRVM